MVWAGTIISRTNPIGASFAGLISCAAVTDRKAGYQLLHIFAAALWTFVIRFAGGSFEKLIDIPTAIAFVFKYRHLEIPKDTFIFIYYT
jgi:hypothetical protein